MTEAARLTAGLRLSAGQTKRQRDPREMTHPSGDQWESTIQPSIAPSAHVAPSASWGKPQQWEMRAYVMDSVGEASQSTPDNHFGHVRCDLAPLPLSLFFPVSKWRLQHTPTVQGAWAASIAHTAPHRHETLQKPLTICVRGQFRSSLCLAVSRGYFTWLTPLVYHSINFAITP